MRKQLFVILAIMGFTPLTAPAQNIITTIAGGGPNNLPALSSNLNTPYGIVKDASGNLYIAGAGANRVYKVDAAGQLTVFAGNGAGGYKGDGGPAVAAELNDPTALFIDASGNIFIADTQNDVIREIVAATGKIQTVAGNGTAGYSGDGGPATSAKLNTPTGLFLDGSGNLFLTDSGNNVIREVSAGTIRTVAGNGTRGYTGDGGPATSATLFSPLGVFIDSSGNLWFADNGNNVIREVVAATGKIQTVAGTGIAGYTGDGGPATSAQLHAPTGLSMDGSANLFIADTGNHVIRKVSAGTIQTIAGSGASGYTGDGGPATSATMRSPVSVFTDSSGNIYVSDTLNFVVRKITQGTIQTIAGNATPNLSGDGALATNAFTDSPWGVVSDASANFFFTEFYGDVVRKVSASTGLIQTVAGTGVQGFAGDGGPATAAQFNSPTGLSMDSSGNLFIADQGNHRIRKVVAATGIIQTVAGNGLSGWTGDGGPATSAQIGNPTAVFVDPSGNFFFGDNVNHVIREVAVATGNISTVAGTGIQGYSGDGGPATKAELNQPFGVFVVGAGNIFISDGGNSRIRKVDATTGTIQTIAGNGTWGYTGDGGPATSAELRGPDDVLVDGAGNVFIADVSNNVIREVVAATGFIQTVAGNGIPDFTGDGGPALQASLHTPSHVAIDPAGNFVIADLNNNRIRKVGALATVQVPVANLSATSLNFGGQRVNMTSAAQSVTLTNNSTQALSVTSIGVTGTNSADFLESNTCGASVAAGVTCTITVTFTPSAIGARSASVTITDNAAGSPQTISLSGTGVAIPTTAAVGSSLNPSTSGRSVTFTATVTASAIVTNIRSASSSFAEPLGAVVRASTPTGTVTFLDGSTKLGTAVLNANGQATFSTSTLSVGAHPITVSYGGDSAFAASTSSVLSQVVNAPSDFAVSSTIATQTVRPGAAANFTVTVTPQPQGSTFSSIVTFSASGLPAGATAKFSPASVTPGSKAATAALTIQTAAQSITVPGSSSRRPHTPVWPLALTGLAAAFLAIAKSRGWSGTRLHVLLPRYALLVLWLGAVALYTAACNGGFGAPGPKSTNYTVMVTATSGSVQHTTSVTLTVQ